MEKNIYWAVKSYRLISIDNFSLIVPISSVCTNVSGFYAQFGTPSNNNKNGATNPHSFDDTIRHLFVVTACLLLYCCTMMSQLKKQDSTAASSYSIDRLNTKTLVDPLVDYTS
jgi:hypothetical protein